MQPPYDPHNSLPPQNIPQSQPPYQPPTPSYGQNVPTQPATQYQAGSTPVWGQQPPTPPVPPSPPQPYRYGGKMLGVLAVIIFLGWWFAFTGYVGNVAIFTLATVVLTILCLALLAIDWRGYTSLAGLIHWRQMSSGQRLGMGCLFYCFLPFMPLIYVVRAMQQHYQATGQSPIRQLQQFFKSLSQRTQQAQIVIATGGLVAALAFCTMTGVAVGGGHPPSSNAAIIAAATNTPSASDAGPSGSGSNVGVLAPTATASPIPKPTATATPKPKPTATPKPACIPGAVNCNPWGYNFSHGSKIYNPPSDFCGYFNCIASFWDSTNGYVEECLDGTYSHSGGRSGSCSHHKGNWRPLLKP